MLSLKIILAIFNDIISFSPGKTGETLDTKFFDMWGGGKCSYLSWLERGKCLFWFVFFFPSLLPTPPRLHLLWWFKVVA